ncbi:hypothetical protein [Natronomonas marina]|jgi:hypothetical protein|uniref:hypothetical protein n=1 Tax=Natronomonas marina TaxID=2961939 RepID=UPI0020C9B843|nr:hypothetical protein [Natronomonas marina]
MEPDERRRRVTRLITLSGLAVAALVPLTALVVAVETDSPALGAVGIVLLAVLFVLVWHG